MRIAMPSRIVDRHVGGNTTYARRIAVGLRERGHEVLTMPASDHPALTIARETAYGWYRSNRGTICHYVADTGPLVRTRNPSVVTVHGIASRWTTVARSPAQSMIWRYRVQRAISGTDALITVSRSSARDVAAVFNVEETDIHVIPHGIDADRFARPTPLSAEAGSWFLPEDFVLYLGNIEPRKNVSNLIRAFQTEQLRASGLPLVIAGKPAWSYAETMALISSVPNVIYLGFVSDQDRVALMQRCRLFVFPSYYEGFGFPVLEALAAGAVVACSERGSLKEVSGPAISLDDLDPDGLAHSIEGALTNDSARTHCLKNGAGWARGFNWDASVTAHIDVYSQVAQL